MSEEDLDGSKVSCDGRHRQTTPLQFDEMLLDVLNRNVRRINVAGYKVVPELSKVALIRRDRSSREATLDKKVVEETLHQRRWLLFFTNRLRS